MESLGKLEETATKVSRDITSARADMKRMETRTTRAGDDASSAKEGVAELSKHILIIGYKYKRATCMYNSMCIVIRIMVFKTWPLENSSKSLAFFPKCKTHDFTWKVVK